MKLNGKVVAISGAGRGIGRALAIHAAREGALVSCCSRTVSAIEETGRLAAQQSSMGDAAVLARPCDVSDKIAASLWIAETARRFGRLDILINNASALGIRGPLADFPEDIWEEVIRVNVNGVFYVTKAALNEIMLAQRSGLIVNISSGVGRVGKPNWGAYVASKFALEGMSQMLANEVRDKGIISIAINPEPTRTPMRAEAYPNEDPMTLKTPEDFAKALVNFMCRVTLADTGKSLDYKNLG